MSVWFWLFLAFEKWSIQLLYVSCHGHSIMEEQTSAELLVVLSLQLATTMTRLLMNMVLENDTAYYKLLLNNYTSQSKYRLLINF